MNSPFTPFDPNTPQSPAPNSPAQLTADDKNWGMIAHLSAFAGIVLPSFGHVLGPLIVWLVKKDQSAFVNDQAKESLNFQISMSIYLVVAALSIFLFIGIFLFPLVALADLILTIIGAIAASNGQAYRYPATIRFIQ